MYKISNLYFNIRNVSKREHETMMNSICMKNSLIICICFVLVCAFSCRKDLLEYGQGDLKISIEQGEYWIHDFPLFLGIKLKNSPQIAIWMEDMQGNYLSTVYVTHKIATQSWQNNNGNPRKEALPHWRWSQVTE